MKNTQQSPWQTAWRIIYLEYRVFLLGGLVEWMGQKHQFHLHDPVVRNLGISPRTGVDIVVTCTHPGDPRIHDGPYNIRVPRTVYLDEITVPLALELLRGVRKKSLGWLTFDRLIDVGRESHPLKPPAIS